MDVLCELYPVEMTAIFASKRIFAAAATGRARTAELPNSIYSLRKKCTCNFATTKLVLLPGLAPGSKSLLPPRKMNF